MGNEKDEDRTNGEGAHIVFIDQEGRPVKKVDLNSLFNQS